jgi:hypothetical protein
LNHGSAVRLKRGSDRRRFDRDAPESTMLTLSFVESDPTLRLFGRLLVMPPDSAFAVAIGGKADIMRMR